MKQYRRIKLGMGFEQIALAYENRKLRMKIDLQNFLFVIANNNVF